MPLTHVCVWDSKGGFRRITIEEACKLHPYGVAARSGYFVCELCAQNVLLTSPGDKAQHFRHDPSSPNKECDERQSSFDPSYGRSIKNLSSHTMPLRISVTGSSFTFQLGFFSPPIENPVCDKIIIHDDTEHKYVYNFERIEKNGTTYLNVGDTPSKTYKAEYINANKELDKYWPTRISGINTTPGSFFDSVSGQILPLGSKAYAGNTYYLLQQRALSFASRDVASEELMKVKSSTHHTTWYLYRIRVKAFTESSAKFFLRYSIFLTEKPSQYYPIWPPYIQNPYFIYHNTNTFYYYICGDDAELKSFPHGATTSVTKDGKLYIISTREHEQLISIGKSGALGFSYLIKKPLDKRAPLPTFTITDQLGNTLSEDQYFNLPKGKMIYVTCPFDGRIVIEKNEKTELIRRLVSEQQMTIDKLSYGCRITIYQGQDLVRSILFEQNKSSTYNQLDDDRLVKELENCSGPMIPVTHAFGAIAVQFEAYPKTKHWLYKRIRRGEIPRTAYLILQNWQKKR